MTGGLIAFGNLRDFAHVEFEIRQLIIESLSEGELSLRILDGIGLLKIFYVEHALGEISGAFLQESLDRGVLVSRVLVVICEFEWVVLFLSGLLYLGSIWP